MTLRTAFLETGIRQIGLFAGSQSWILSQSWRTDFLHLNHLKGNTHEGPLSRSSYKGNLALWRLDCMILVELLQVAHAASLGGSPRRALKCAQTPLNPEN